MMRDYKRDTLLMRAVTMWKQPLCEEENHQYVLHTVCVHLQICKLSTTIQIQTPASLSCMYVNSKTGQKFAQWSSCPGRLQGRWSDTITTIVVAAQNAAQDCTVLSMEGKSTHVDVGMNSALFFVPNSCFLKQKGLDQFRFMSYSWESVLREIVCLINAGGAQIKIAD